jgi:hypothetical protein
VNSRLDPGQGPDVSAQRERNHHSLPSWGRTVTEVSMQQTEQSMMMVLHVAILVPQTQSSNLSTYQSKMRVSRVAMLVPRTKFKPINIPVNNDGNLHGYVNAHNVQTYPYTSRT